ncbi:MAG: hypothetical protein FWH02_01780 [Oscillospiraceae bacterium]|nr:hypothetical protein [Oscillospiraceae bacterium]
MSTINGLYGNPNRNQQIITQEDDRLRALGQTKPRTSGGSELGMNDFLQILAAQLANQDMMNPVSDTEFIAQMAQFSSLQAMNTLTEYTLSAYAVSYTGKHVIISSIDPMSRRMETVYGQVERVTFAQGQPRVVVNGKEYELHTVMEIADKEIRPPADQARSVVNRYVAIQAETGEEGLSELIFGLVARAAFIDGRNQVLVNNRYFNYSDILKVSDRPLTLETYQTQGEDPPAIFVEL